MKHKDIDWSKIDWRKSNADIHRETGVAKHIIIYRRSGIGDRQLIRGSYAVDWDKADWTKPNQQIAEALKTTPQSVFAARKRLAPQNLKHNPTLMSARRRALRNIKASVSAAHANVEAQPKAPAIKPSFWSRLAAFVGLSIIFK